MNLEAKHISDVELALITLKSPETTLEDKFSAAFILENRAHDHQDSEAAFQLGDFLLHTRLGIFNPGDGFRFLDLASQLAHPMALKILNDINILCELRRNLPLEVWKTFRYLFPGHRFSRLYLKDLSVMEALDS